MEQNLPLMARKMLNLVRVAYYMLRKGISKGKVMMELNVLMEKRGKIADIGSLTSSSAARRHHLHFPVVPTEYEFSCSNSPAFPAFQFGKRRRQNGRLFACVHQPETLEDDVVTVAGVKAALEMLNSNEAAVEASPALPGFGFGRSPAVRQLRITDSPFPLRDANEDSHVDKACEDFINRFYKDLRLQKKTMAE